MVLGMKVFVILVVACSFGLAIVILPSTPQTAPAYNCFVTTKECVGADPMYVMTKIMPEGSMPRYG